MPAEEPLSSTWQEAEGTCVQQAPLPFSLHQMCLPPARHQACSLLQKGCPTSCFDRQAWLGCRNAPQGRCASRQQEIAHWAEEQPQHLPSHLESMPLGIMC